jgi:hypothetical protein
LTWNKINQTKLAGYRIRDVFEAFSRFGVHKRRIPNRRVFVNSGTKTPLRAGEKVLKERRGSWDGGLQGPSGLLFHTADFTPDSSTGTFPVVKFHLQADPV